MKLKHIMLRAVLFFGFTYLLLGFLNFICIDQKLGTGLMLNELYGQEDNIDILFLGSSHTYWSINPVIVDRETRSNAFNAGSSSQAMDTSLTLLKEAIKGNNIEEVYLEMYFGVIDIVQYKERMWMTKQYIISDYMPLSINKVQYLLAASDREWYVHSFFPAKREINNLLDIEYITEQLKKKLTSSYLNLTYDPEAESGYAGKGFVRSDTIVTDEVLQNISMQEYREPSQDYEDSLLEIVNICKEEGIQLTLFVTPMPTQLLDQCEGGYDLYVDRLNEWSEEYGIMYYDFNLCKEEVLDLGIDEFKDTDHLNGTGADKFTEVLCKLMYHSSDVEVEDAFYKSYEEKVLQGEVTR